MLIDTDKTSLDLDSILFQAMLDEIGAYVYIKDSHAKYLYVNEETRQLFQQPLEAILGHADSDFFTGQQLSDLSKNDQRVLLYGEIVRHEDLNIPKSTGEARIFRTVKKPLFNKQGMILGLIGILTDITDIAQLETTNGLLENALDSEKIKAENQNKRHVQDVAQKNDAIKLAKQSNIAKSQFLATMSHEIRTPLNAFIGSAELLKNTILTPGQSSYVDVAQQSAITVKQVIDDVLNFSKIEAGKVEVAVRETDIIALVDSVVTLMGIQAAKKDLELAVFISDNIPEIVLLDCVKTKQILLNLVSNAIKFTEQGRVEIRLTAEQQQEQEHQDYIVTFSIQDTGIGIEKKVQETIFDEFTQVGSLIPHPDKGTGLGLAISHRMISMVGGCMGLESEIGKGSRFWFSLPVKAKSLLTLNPVNTDCWILNRDTHSNHQAEFFYRQIQPLVQQVRIVDTCKNIVLSSAQPAIIFLDQSQLGCFNRQEIIQFTDNKPDHCLMVLVSNYTSATLSQQWLNVFDKQLIKPFSIRSLQEFLSLPMGSEKERLQAVTSLGEAPVFPEHVQQILLVEDNVANQLVIKLMLEKLGYRVDLAENGSVATETVKHKKYDLILMDLSMPVMGGIKAATLIHHAGENSAPIIALTADAFEETKALCLQVGMDGFLAKPITLNCLKQELDKHLHPHHELDRHTAVTAELIVAKRYPVNLNIDYSVLDLLRQETSEVLFPQILTIFLEQGGKRVVLIENAISNQDFTLLKNEVHALKSESATFGAIRLSELMESINLLCMQHLEQQAFIKSATVKNLWTEAVNEISKTIDEGELFSA